MQYRCVQCNRIIHVWPTYDRSSVLIAADLLHYVTASHGVAAAATARRHVLGKHADTTPQAPKLDATLMTGNYSIMN